MPTVLQFRRGTTTQNNSFTGTAGELSVDTTLDTLRVHDGSTAGGFTLLKETGTSNLTLNAQAEIRLGDSDSSNYVGFKSPGTVASNLIFTLPSSDGTSGQALVTDASGNLSFAAAGATVTQDNSTNSNFNLYFAATTSGALTALKYDGGDLLFNPSTSTLTCATFAGNATTATTASGVSANSVALTTDTTGNYVAAGATSGSGISGSVSSEGGTFTVTSNATNANTGSTIVFRDGSGNFSAGTITAIATNAQYANLAEKYTSDNDYEPGTVVELGGTHEVTQTRRPSSIAIAGIVSTNPAYLMNNDLEGVSVALIGRVPCKVTGKINKGDLLVSSDVLGLSLIHI